MKKLEAKFKEAGIDFTKIGFYDDPKFIACEENDNKYLEKYAEYILLKNYTADYIERAKNEIPYIALILNEELKKDGRLGACIDMSIGLSRILEQEGFWNYIPKGSLTIELPPQTKIPKKYFWSVDFGNFKAGHVWVVAPPFSVIDLTLTQQSYPDNTKEYLPDFICSTSDNTAIFSESDIISPEALFVMRREGISSRFMEHIRPDWNDFLHRFKVVEVHENDLSLKYITTGISAPDMPIEKVETLKLSGKITIEIYNDIIIPKLKEFREAK